MVEVNGFRKTRILGIQLFLTHGNKVKIGGKKLGNGGCGWVGFGTRRRRAYWASGLITVAGAHNSMGMIKKHL